MAKIDDRVSDDFRAIRQVVEKRLNEELGERHYGDSLVKLAIVPMILRPEFAEGRAERRLIKREEGIADYRLFIHWEAWSSSSLEDKQSLLLLNVLASIDDISRKLGKAFDGARLRSDIIRVFPEIANKSMHATCETHARDG